MRVRRDKHSPERQEPGPADAKLFSCEKPVDKKENSINIPARERYRSHPQKYRVSRRKTHSLFRVQLNGIPTLSGRHMTIYQQCLDNLNRLKLLATSIRV